MEYYMTTVNEPEDCIQIYTNDFKTLLRIMFICNSFATAIYVLCQSSFAELRSYPAV